MEPTKFKRRRIGIHVIFIPFRNIGATNANFSANFSLLNPTRLVQNNHFLAHGLSNRPGFVRPILRQRVRSHEMRRFRHRISFQHRRTESLLEFAQNSRGQRSAAASYEPEPRVNRFGVVRVAVQYNLVYGGDRSVPRGIVLHHVFPERGGGEPSRRRQRHRRTGRKGTEQPRNQTVHVKKRKHNHRRVRLSESVHRFNVLYRREQVVLSERHSLGSACGAGGVKEKRHVIRIVNH
ncbi:hypothetical protein VIGAN_11182300 [Vigna angularis var. angularis]|uniref:Uncharacterized protein n=1 Tax=Vigna angularis var. angularis TaxID=157739 RepID=A0A0S3TAR9_PHAAN|nr:hypothetical protein VIGAN_11182300 [Vigna angularis var. angularis]